MDNKDFDKLGEQPVKIDDIEKPKTAGSFLDEYYKTLGDGSLELIGVKTGMDKLDKATLGLDGLIVLGGIAGQGKTSLALQLAFDACRHNTPTVFYSLEMPRRSIFTKILNRLAKVGYTDILLKGRQYLDSEFKNTNQTGQGGTDTKRLLKEDEVEALKKAKEDLKLASENFYIRSRERGQEPISFETVEQEINLIKAEHRTEKVFIVIDHLQVFNVDAKEYTDRIDKEGRLINGFKDISERTGATILLISQKNKAGFTSRGLQTIKGSVDIVYLADVVMFLEGDSEKKQDDNVQSVIAHFGGAELKPIDLIIDKNRYNTPTTINLDFDGRHSEFLERHT